MADEGAPADGTVRCWLVERDYWDEDVVTLVYATPDGERFFQRQLSAGLLTKIDVTAAKDVPEDELEATPPGDREQYATEAQRVRERHDADETL